MKNEAYLEGFNDGFRKAMEIKQETKTEIVIEKKPVQVIPKKKTVAGGWREIRVWTQDEEDVLRALYGHVRAAVIAKRLQRSVSSIHTRAKKFGLQRKRHILAPSVENTPDTSVPLASYN